MIPQEKSIPMKDMFLLELTNLPTKLVGRQANGGLAGAVMRAYKRQTGR